MMSQQTLCLLQSFVGNLSFRIGSHCKATLFDEMCKAHTSLNSTFLIPCKTQCPALQSPKLRGLNAQGSGLSKFVQSGVARHSSDSHSSHNSTARARQASSGRSILRHRGDLILTLEKPSSCILCTATKDCGEGGDNYLETEQPQRVGNESQDFCVVNFYLLSDIKEPHAAVAKHRRWLQGKDILGRIYLSHQGINAQYSGPTVDAHAYARWFSEQEGAQGLHWSSDPVAGHQFPRLRLKYKENLVQLAGGTQHLPITNPQIKEQTALQSRAKPLEPQEWQAMLRDAVPVTDAGEGAASKPVVMDVRNAYEWDSGHFTAAARPTEGQFSETPTTDLPEVLANADKQRPIMMYCTGGIRCDIYSTLLRQKGFSNIYSLKGGIANYLRQAGDEHWKGSLFTFDDRIALAPDGSCLKPEGLKAATPCRCCGGESVPPHLNCANIDCNRLFLACQHCQSRLKGCCCEGCMSAPRMLRPRSISKPFPSWHHIASAEDLPLAEGALLSGRGEGRSLRRQKRAKRLKAKRAEHQVEKARRKELVRAACRTEAEQAQVATLQQPIS